MADEPSASLNDFADMENRQNPEEQLTCCPEDPVSTDDLLDFLSTADTTAFAAGQLEALLSDGAEGPSTSQAYFSDTFSVDDLGSIQGSILQNFVLAENFSEKISSSNFVQIQ
jgi:hypothetical protein